MIIDPIYRFFERNEKYQHLFRGFHAGILFMIFYLLISERASFEYSLTNLISVYMFSSFLLSKEITLWRIYRQMKYIKRMLFILFYIIDVFLMMIYFSAYIHTHVAAEYMHFAFAGVLVSGIIMRLLINMVFTRSVIPAFTRDKAS